MYKVTLAMPVYNVEKYIERALLSALNQTFDSIEYLLIDDRGSDNSISLAKDIIKNHPRGKDVRIIVHEVNIGTGATKNTAIDNAQGEFLYFMDSDDEITPDCISILYNKMLENPVDFVAASHNVISSDEKIRDQVVFENCIIEKGEFEVARSFYLKEKIITTYTWNKLYDLNFLRQNNIRCIFHHLNEDIFFTYQVILNAQSCRFLSDIVYSYYEAVEYSTMSKMRKPFTQKMAEQFEEIISLKKDYSHNYRTYDFYPNLIKRIFLCYAMPFSISIYYSKLIDSKKKHTYISNILKYPIFFKDMIFFKSKIHYIIFALSKLPTIYLKIFACRLFLKISHLLNLKIV
ncbi:MAG: glycosyltransferase [Fusobacteriaceae bacterium]|jgi:glycosyltransferase involved in cell wall biosynthesis|nr:glycosyltransferase [Fusobacteriaceae bacterium]